SSRSAPSAKPRRASMWCAHHVLGPMNIRLVLVSDQLLSRQGLRALFGIESDIEVVGEADYGTDAVDVVLGTRPDIVLVDLTMPEMEGVAVARLIHDDSPGGVMDRLALSRSLAEKLN